MIELTDHPNSAMPRPIDTGFTQRGQAGPAGRINRKGSHWALDITFPPMKLEDARKLNTDLTWSLREGARIEVPLLGVSQGVPGSPVVDGAGQAGTVLDIRGLTPHYAVKKGFWLHVQGAGGKRYLHQVKTPAIASAVGEMSVGVWPEIGAPFADGAIINLANPTIEGAVEGFDGWMLSPDRISRFGGTITIEESVE